MTFWIIASLFVAGLTLGMACCCDGGCLDCSISDIEGLTIAVTLSGTTGTETLGCVDATTPSCSSLWDVTFLTTYEFGVGTEGCIYGYDDGSVISCCQRGIELDFALGPNVAGFGFIDVVISCYGTLAYWNISGLNTHSCDIDEDLAFLYYVGGLTACDFTGTTVNVATV